MDYDRAYANGPFIPGAETFPPRWTQEAAAFRAALGQRARTAIPYGPKPRNALDLFLPEAAPLGLLVFVHGGYWLRFDRDLWSHLAAGAVARGWACAMPSYTLAPQARISAMTQEIARAVEVAAGLVAGPVVVTGHSAGGHLSARMGCADVTLSAAVKRVVPISPLADLEPISLTRDERRPASRCGGNLLRRALPCSRRVPASRPMSGSARRNGRLFFGKLDFCPKPGRARGRRKAASITLTSLTD